MPPQTSTKLFSKSLITAGRIFVSEAIAQQKDQQLRGPVGAMIFLPFNLPILLWGGLMVELKRVFKQFFLKIFWWTVRSIKSLDQVHPPNHPCK